MSSFYYTTPSGTSWWLMDQSTSAAPPTTPLNDTMTTTREESHGLHPDAAASSSEPAAMVDNTSSPSLLTPSAARRHAHRARRQHFSHNQGAYPQDIDRENIPSSIATRPARERRATTRTRQRTRNCEASCSGEPQYRRVMADLPQDNVAPRSRARTLPEIDAEASSSSH